VQIDNIIVGNLVEGLTEDQIGIHSSEDTIRLSFKQAINDKGDLFLPNILKNVGLFKSTSEIRKINDQRLKSDKFKNIPNQNLWRTCIQPEMTSFKIGKKVFWLIIGEE
jgi:hypothetical protein